MNPEYKIQDLIDRYLNGEMSESEKLEFEVRLSADADLMQAFKAQKVVNKIVIGEELIKLKAQMSRDLANNNYPGGSSATPARYVLIATGIVLSAILLYFGLKDRSEINHTEGVKEKTSLTKSIEFIPLTIDTVIPKAGKEELPVSKADNNHTPVSPQSVHPINQGSAGSGRFATDSIINFSCQARGTCLHKQDGAIEIDLTTIKSGTPPFLFSVNRKDNFQKESILVDLSPGIYTLYVKDSKQCLYTLDVNVEVPVTDCEYNLPQK